MAEPFSALKGSKKTKEEQGRSSGSFLQYTSNSLNETKSGRLSLIPNLRSHRINKSLIPKIASSSLERLASEKDSNKNSDVENYNLEYSMYLLSKLQNAVLIKNKQEKEDNVKRCFVSLKLELEELLAKNVHFSKEIGYFEAFFKTIRVVNEQIEIGKKVLVVLRESKFDNLLTSLSRALDHKINQLQLIDVDRDSIMTFFDEYLSKEGSEMNDCLQKLDSCAMKNKDQISKIAEELTKVKELCLENSVLRERCYQLFETISNEILETNYEVFTGMVKKAFSQRMESCKSGLDYESEIFNIQDILKIKPMSIQGTPCHFSQIESPCVVKPNGTSTPQPDH